MLQLWRMRDALLRLRGVDKQHDIHD